MSDSVISVKTTRPKIDIVDHAFTLIVVCLVGLVMNTVGPAIPIADGFVGMVVIYLISMVGLLLTRYAPFYLPSVAWISLVGIVATLPWTPGSEWIVAQAKSVNFLALATPALAYAGFAILIPHHINGDDCVLVSPSFGLSLAGGPGPRFF